MNKLLTRVTPVVAMVLLFAGCASRTETHDDHHGNTQLNIKAPEGAANIFAETEKHLQALAAAVKSKDARAVHEHDTAVRQLIGRIPQRATPDIKVHVDDRQLTTKTGAKRMQT